MRHSPSIIPANRLDRDMYLVLEDFSSGAAWRETDEDRTDYRILISDLLTGQYDHPLRVVAFNPLEGWSRDASEDVAHELEQRGAEGHEVTEPVRAVHRTLHWPANWRATIAAAARVLRLQSACFPGRSDSAFTILLYDFTLLLDVVTITGLPAFITRAVWVNPSSELLRIEMPKPATYPVGQANDGARGRNFPRLTGSD